jgi:dCMP deaminase
MSRASEKDEVFLHMARILSTLGTCSRAQVGCIITRNGRAISWGYNGAPPGMPHCMDNNHGYPLVETRYENGCLNATHAEANALAAAARQGISTEGATLYTTVSPCTTCSRLIIAAGIARVVWTETYRDTSGIELLVKAGLSG